MFTAAKIESTIKPTATIALGNGVWYYNYDISEYVMTSLDGEGKEVEEVRYSYVQVRISGEPTVEKCSEAILKAFVDEHGKSLYHLLTVEGTRTDQIDDIYFNIKVDFGQEEALTELE